MKQSKFDKEDLDRVNDARRAYMREYRRKRKESMSDSELLAERDKVNEYQRNWRKNNPEKVKAANIRYWINKLDRDEQDDR